MSFINKEELLEGLKNKKFCKHCVYVGRNNKCFYPSDMSCSPAAMSSAIIQMINEMPEDFISEIRYTNEYPLRPDYVAVLEKAFNESINKSPEEAKEELIRMGVLNEDGTPKERIVDNE